MEDSDVKNQCTKSTIVTLKIFIFDKIKFNYIQFFDLACIFRIEIRQKDVAIHCCVKIISVIFFFFEF